MVKLLMVTILGLMVSCGGVKKYYLESETANFEGRFYLENNSYIELMQNGEEVYILSNGQLLTTVNPKNNTFAELPKLSGKHDLNNNQVRITRNMNFTSGHDVEEDESGRDIRGQRRVDVSIYYTDNKLTLKYDIYSDRLNDNANNIVASRTLTEE